jgi:hypothetical protein
MAPEGTDSTREAGRALLSAAAEGGTLVPPQALRYVELLRGVPAVRHVAFGSRGGVLRLWAVLATYDVAANDAVFSRELQMYEEWPDAKLDFRVVALEGRTVTSAIPSDLDVVWTRDA